MEGGSLATLLKCFNWKIVLYLLVEQKEAQRTRIKIVRSTLFTIPITSFTKEVIKDVLINKLIPEIIDKSPGDKSTITIQLDVDSDNNIESDIDIYIGI